MRLEDKLGTGRCIVVAEVAQAHDGSLGTAHAYIDAAAQAGADAVKFQTHMADAESTPGEPWRVKFSPQDDTRYDYWKRMEFTESQWAGLKAHADEVGLDFLSTPFSFEAVELLKRVGVSAWKVASGEVTNKPMLDLMIATGLPLIVSSGMSSYQEIERAAAVLLRGTAPVVVMQCTSMYPTPVERVGLNVIAQLRKLLPECFVGLSDHSGSVFPGLAAATLGIDVLEVHITLSRASFGPDVPASLTLSEFQHLVTGIRYIEALNQQPVDKDKLAIELDAMRKLFMKSVVAGRKLPAGHVVRYEDLVFKKPGTGILANEVENVVGKQLVRSIAANQIINYKDLSD